MFQEEEAEYAFLGDPAPRNTPGTKETDLVGVFYSPAPYN